MIGLDELQRLAVQQLIDKGIPAAAQARDLADLPAALVTPTRFRLRSLSGVVVTAHFDVYLLAADNGHELDALNALSDMTAALAHHYGAADFETVTVTLANLGGADPLPALKTEIIMNFKEDHE